MKAGAFGSGEHETTRSCLEMLELLKEVQGAHILDLGSGTGILSIAALKLGAQSALCVDIEQTAVSTCKANCSLNGVADRVDHFCGTIEQICLDSFDLIVANIYGDILVNISNELACRTSTRGLVLLSGILHQDNYDVKRSYQKQGFDLLRNRMLHEYTTMLFRKSSS